MTVPFAMSYVLVAALLLYGFVVRADRRVLRRVAEARVDPAAEPSMLRRIGRLLPRRLHAGAGVRFGVPSEQIERLLGIKVIGALAGALVGASLATGVARLPLACVLAAGGYTLPTFRLARRARARAAAVRRAAPDLLDLLAVSVSAGITPRLALDRATRVVGEPLASALGEIRGAVSLGAPWLAALRRAAALSGADELRRLAATLALSARLGTPVSERLRALAHDVRSERRAEAEARARRAPVTMLFPLVFLILPAFVLTAVVPALIVATRGVG